MVKKSDEEMKEKKNVIVVDDDPHLLYTTERVLSEDGWNVIKYESGKECLKEMNDGFEGIILMDIMMPEMDGWETVEKIAEKYGLENMVVAMLTAVDSPEEERVEQQQFVVDYIRKPFEPEKLKDKLETYLKYLRT